VIFEEFEVDEAALKPGQRRGYIGDESGKNDIAETSLVSEYGVCLFVRTECRGSKFETMSMYGGDIL
jgi:hypothetical protein